MRARDERRMTRLRDCRNEAAHAMTKWRAPVGSLLFPLLFRGDEDALAAGAAHACHSVDAGAGCAAAFGSAFGSGSEN
jgi:hypothetical protein